MYVHTHSRITVGARGLALMFALWAGTGAAKSFVVDTDVDLPDGNILDGICSHLEYPELQPDKPTCSLRAAVTQANAIPLADDPNPITIHLKPGATYEIGGDHHLEVSGRVGDLDVSRPMHIGVASIFQKATVRRTQGTDRLFEFHAGAAGSRLYGVRMSNTQSHPGLIARGAPDAGAVEFHDIEVRDTGLPHQYQMLLFNTPLSIVDSEFHHGGSSLWINGAVATIERSTFHASSGTAISLANHANLTLRQSTVSGNDVAVHATWSNLFVIGSTFASNASQDIVFRPQNAGQTLRIDNSLFATGGSNCVFYDEESFDPVHTAGQVTVNGSVFDDASCFTNTGIAGAPNLHDASIQLTAIGSRGGMTSTHDLLPTSDGIDWIPPQYCQANGTDQRGFPRAVSYSGMEPAHCDAGASELQLTQAPPEGAIFADGFEGD